VAAVFSTGGSRAAGVPSSLRSDRPLRGCAPRAPPPAHAQRPLPVLQPGTYLSLLLVPADVTYAISRSLRVDVACGQHVSAAPAVPLVGARRIAGGSSCLRNSRAEPCSGSCGWEGGRYEGVKWDDTNSRRQESPFLWQAGSSTLLCGDKETEY
jgi:hypothetical protein